MGGDQRASLILYRSLRSVPTNRTSRQLSTLDGHVTGAAAVSHACVTIQMNDNPEISRCKSYAKLIELLNKADFFIIYSIFQPFDTSVFVTMNIQLN